VEYTTKEPTIGPEPEDGPIGNLCPLGVDLSKDIYLESKRDGKNLDKDSKAIFLIRNYRDIFIRRTFEKVGEEDFLQKTYFEDGFDKYMSIVQAYDEFQGEKLLIYFEDLIKEPNEEINKILKFLNIENEYSNDFIDNYERHFRCCLGIYRRAFPGGDLTVYPGLVPVAIKSYMDDVMLYNSPILFGKYLTRYIELYGENSPN